MTEGSSPIEVFCSYAHKDEVWLHKLIIHLRFLEHERSLLIWHDRLLKGGMDWSHEIDDRLNHSRLILLLISPDFVASDYCYGIEMRRALERHEANAARVIPILVRPIGNWQNAPFAHLQALPPGKFLVEWSEREEDIPFAQIANGIHEILKDLSTQTISMLHPTQIAIWNIPYPRNHFFIGRDALLSRLHQQLHTGQATALSQPQAIGGLGGIGKTQVAVEYAFQHHQDYQAVLWTLADTRESLVSGYIAIAKLLNLPQKDEQDPIVIVEAVLLWFKTHTHWLLILDNADDLAVVRAFLPSVFSGHILLTTRAQATGRLVRRIEVEVLPRDVGALFLLRRASLIAPDAPLESANATDIALAKEICEELGGLPLALDQAGAYIEETHCGLSGYQSLYRTRRAEILNERGGLIDDHPEPVATTWSLSFENVEQKNSAAADLLRFCAFLHPDAIPEELLLAGAKHLGLVLQPLVSDPSSLNKAIAALGAYSLVSRDPKERTLSIHRLVQAVLKDAMDPATQRNWAQRAVLAVNEAFPKEVEFSMWQKCEQWLPQALACAVLIEQGNLILLEAASLLHRIVRYLDDRGRYAESEPMCQRALLIREQQLGPEHHETLASLNNLALLYSEQGKYAEAKPLLQRLLLIKEQQFGPEHISTSRGMYNLAELYGYESKYVEAEPLFRRVLGIREQQLGLEHPLVAFPLTGLANLFYEQGQYAEAQPLYLRALSIREQQLEPEHPDTAQSLNNLARLYTAQKQYEQAESLFQHALTIREHQLGVEHPETAVSLIDIAVLYSQMKRYAEAKVLYERVLRIYERTLGVEHQKTWTTRKEYIALLALIKQEKEA
jgi:tetratricopeptide (TPR) repeat protein